MTRQFILDEEYRYLAKLTIQMGKKSYIALLITTHLTCLKYAGYYPSRNYVRRQNTFPFPR